MSTRRQVRCRNTRSIEKWGWRRDWFETTSHWRRRCDGVDGRCNSRSFQEVGHSRRWHNRASRIEHLRLFGCEGCWRSNGVDTNERRHLRLRHWHRRQVTARNNPHARSSGRGHCGRSSSGGVTRMSGASRLAERAILEREARSVGDLLSVLVHGIEDAVQQDRAVTLRVLFIGHTFNVVKCRVQATLKQKSLVLNKGWGGVVLDTYLRGQEFGVLRQLRAQNIADIIAFSGLAENDDFFDQILQALDGRWLLAGLRSLQQNFNRLVYASSGNIAQQCSANKIDFVNERL